MDASQLIEKNEVKLERGNRKGSGLSFHNKKNARFNNVNQGHTACKYVIKKNPICFRKINALLGIYTFKKKINSIPC